MNAHCSFSLSSSKLETAQVFANRRRDRPAVAHAHNGILLFNKTGPATATQNNADESHRRDIEILCDSLSVKYKVGKTELGTK